MSKSKSTTRRKTPSLATLSRRADRAMARARPAFKALLEHPDAIAMEEERKRKLAQVPAPPAEAAEREPVSPATIALLDEANHSLTDAQSVLTILRRSFDDDGADERAVIERVLDLLNDVSESVQYAAMGVPVKAPLWHLAAAEMLRCNGGEASGAVDSEPAGGAQS